MATINLRDFYPFYQHDQFVEVPDELAFQLAQWERNEQAYMRRRNRHHAFYSMDCFDGIERDVLFMSISPDEHYERRLTRHQLYDALSMLPNKQANRIISYYLKGTSQTAIAKIEGVSRNTVSKSIRSGLKMLERFLKNH